MKPVKSLDWQWYGTGAAIVDIADSVTEYAINCDTPNESIPFVSGNRLRADNF